MVIVMVMYVWLGVCWAHVGIIFIVVWSMEYESPFCTESCLAARKALFLHG